MMGLFSKSRRYMRDAVLWDGMLSPTVMRTKTGNWMTVLRYQPRDLAVLSIDEMADSDEKLNRVIMRLGPQWTMWVELSKIESAEYPQSEWGNVAAAALDAERKSTFVAAGAQYDSAYYISLLYAPNGGKAALQRESERFLATLDAFEMHLCSLTMRVERISGDALAQYLHSCVSTRKHYVRAPSLLSEMGAEWLVDCEFDPKESMLGSDHLRVVKIKSQPDRYVSGILDSLNLLRFPMRVVARWQPLDQETAKAEINARKSLWADSIIPWTQQAAKAVGFGNHDTSMDDPLARAKRGETDHALVALGQHAFGYWTQTVTVHHPDLDTVKDWVSQIQSRISNQHGFVCAAVSGINTQQAWMGTIPGHPQADLEKLLQCSLSLAASMPFSAEWTGPKQDEHLKGPPLLRLSSETGTPFRWALHQPGQSAPAGHGLIDGATGSGKSTLIGEGAVGFQRYKASRVIFIDYLASAKCVTYILGGRYYDLAASSGVQLQPLACVNGESERQWAFGWIIERLAEKRILATPEQEREIDGALVNLGARPIADRTLSNFQALVQDDAIRDAIGAFCLGGQAGHILDNNSHDIGESERVRCFETANLIENNAGAVAATMSVVFHEIERSLDGNPTLLVIDEAQRFLRIPSFQDKLQQLLETARKRNCAVVLLTPNLSAFMEIDNQNGNAGKNTSLTELIKRSCQWKIFGAYDKASTKGSRESYAAMGLSGDLIKIIDGLEKPREFLFTCGAGVRKFRFDATPVELACVGSNSDEAKLAMDEVMNAGPRDQFMWRWLANRGFDAGFIEDLRNDALRMAEGE